jgi:hypothetical protein
MTDNELKLTHLDFFVRNASGCAFAAHVARDPDRFEWAIEIVRVGQMGAVDEIILNAVADEGTSTLSLVFPDVLTQADLIGLIPMLDRDTIFLHETKDVNSNRCYRFRSRIGDEVSYISGFAPFEAMPITRRAEIVSIVMRVGRRPAYDWDFKTPEPGIIHVADMDMKGLADRNLKRMWQNSFLRTAGLLGHKPDEESAAKTTFVIPLAQAQQILI